MEKLMHWTQRSTKDFMYSISSDFMAQLETRMEEDGISRSDLARLLGKSNGRVSQVFNDPGNLSLKVIVEFARTLGMKVSIVAYDDGDPADNNGPINPEVFVKSWEKVECPRDLFDIAQIDAKQMDTGWLYAGVSAEKPQPVFGSIVRGRSPWAESAAISPQTLVPVPSLCSGLDNQDVFNVPNHLYGQTNHPVLERAL